MELSTTEVALCDDALVSIMEAVGNNGDDPTFCKCTKLLCKPNDWTRKAIGIRRPIVFDVLTNPGKIKRSSAVSLILSGQTLQDPIQFDITVNGEPAFFKITFTDQNDLSTSYGIKIVYGRHDMPERARIRILPRAGQLDWISHMLFHNVGTGRQTTVVFNSVGNVGVVTLAKLFAYTDVSIGKISHLDVTNIDNMNGLFYDCKRFNQPIGNWNVSNVWDMSEMFYNCANFNQEIGDWKTDNVIALESIFRGAIKFNGRVGKWNLWRVKRIEGAFAETLFSLPTPRFCTCCKSIWCKRETIVCKSDILNFVYHARRLRENLYRPLPRIFNK